MKWKVKNEQQAWSAKLIQSLYGYWGSKLASEYIQLQREKIISLISLELSTQTRKDFQK
jgi:hypothetical protein